MVLVCSADLQAAPPYEPTMPAHPEALEFYLHTIDVGALVYNNFGHTALRVVNSEEGTDLVYNWGIFDFSDPVSFGFTFYKGILIYQLGIYPYAAAMRMYRYERRTVWEDKFNLDSAQKRVLMERLIWHARPENRSYRYDYFFDNCSTRPRDYFDEAVGGAVQRFVAGHMTGEVFRDMVRSHYATIPFVRVGLDVLMNSRIDKQMSVWQKMFLPKTLRSVLLEVPSGQAPDGRLVPMLSPVSTLVEFPAPVPYPRWIYFVLVLVGGGPLLAGVMLAWRHQTIPKPLMRVAGFVTLKISFLAGGYGLLMPTTWIQSEHLDLHHNVNQWLFWPLDWVFLCVACAWLFKGRGWRLGARSASLLRGYSLAHLVAAGIYLLLFLVGFFAQNVREVIPLMFVLAVLMSAFTFLRGTLEET